LTIVPLVVEQRIDPKEVIQRFDMKLIWCRFDYTTNEWSTIYEEYLLKGKIIIEWLGADFKYEGRIITGPELEELISDLCNDQNAQALWINTNLDKVVIARIKE
jgi:hypothetical protein